MKIARKIIIASLTFSLFFVESSTASNDTIDIENTHVSGKIITYDIEKVNTYTKHFEEGITIPLSVFLDNKKKGTGIPDKSEIKIFKTYTDDSRDSHHRAKQYYKGIEVAEVQILLHEYEGKIYQAHGNLVPEIIADTQAAITEKEAYKYALIHIGSNAVLWKSLFNQDHNGKLIFTSGRDLPKPENLRLAYRFDIVIMRPLGRYYIDIDAQTGQLINRISKLNEGDVFSHGESLYHDIVPITISDADYPTWRDTTKWHTNNWESLDKTGPSWWLADTTLGKNGGYENHWYEVLETPPIVLSGFNHKLSFFHRYKVEEPGVYEEYDGWDGMNVRISTDNGDTWEILTNPNRPYTCSSLFSFGYEHAEGPGIPGWAGKLEQWTRVVFDISQHKDDTVIIRFAFASDPAFSTVDSDENLFGWQIDNIRISNNFGALFFDEGTHSQMLAKNLAEDVRFIEGNYRLREVGRGGGISTYNAYDIESYNASIDFVSDESVFSQMSNQAGVTAHWAQEVTYDYFLNHHGRRSYDDADGRLIAYVNWNSGDGKNNASWIGFATVFGSGDGKYYNPLSDLDIVGHEITHGVTEYSAGLIYENEPGALNESFSDIFGIAIEINKLGLNDDSWQIGENVTISSDNIRSMKNPNSRSQPDTYKGNYWRRSTSDPVSNNDWGGVHYNSGVQNYWFYLLSVGGDGINDNNDSYSVTAIGIEDAAKIAYRNLTLYLQPTSSYWDAANYSVQSAIDLFGENSVQHLSVIDAWYAVGIYFTPKISVASAAKFNTQPGQTSDKNIYVRNLGMQDLIIDDIQIAGNHFYLESDHTLPITIAPEEQFSFKITYKPLSENKEDGLITIYCNDPYHPVKEISLQGNAENPAAITLTSDTKSEFELYQNFPNPFVSETMIQYTLPSESSVLLKIYNLSGEEIRTLVQQKQTKGMHTISWDGMGNSGNRAGTGIYIYTIQTDEFNSSRRLIIQ